MRNKVIATLLALTLGYIAFYTWLCLYISAKNQTSYQHLSLIQLQIHDSTAIDPNEANWNDGLRQSLPTHNSVLHPKIQPRNVPQQTLHTNGEKHGYVLTLDYGGQQGAGIHGVVSQQCWVGSFSLPMSIVEPFIKDSLVGNSGKTESVIRFSDYFDMGHFNSVSEREGYAKLATWEEFLENAPRDMVYVHMQDKPSTQMPRRGRKMISRNRAEMAWNRWKSAATVSHDLDISEGIIWDGSVNQQGSTHECYRMMDQLPSQLQPLITKHGFCIVRVVKLPYTEWHKAHAFEEWEHDTILKGLKLKNMSMVFNMWAGSWYAPNYALKNPFLCKNVSERDLEGKLYPSELLLKHAKIYEDMFLQPKSSIAVMLQAEQVSLQPNSVYAKSSRIERTIDSCLAETKMTILRLRIGATSHRTGEIFVTADVGKYTSTAWAQTLSILSEINEQSDTILEPYKTSQTFEEWEESFSQATGGIKDNGYIAALQRTIASRAECLVLVGGGNFQRLVLYEYLHNHPDRFNRCVHFVCLDPLHQAEFHKIMQRVF